MNIDTLRSQLDCREVVRSIIGDPKLKSPDTYSYVCPFHRGKNPSFTVWKNGWKCWSDCQESGDAFAFVMKYYGVSFKAAVSKLAGNETMNTLDHRHAAQRFAPPPTKPDEPPDDEWMGWAGDVCRYSHQILTREPEGERARDYLRKRGVLNWSTWLLGYLPARNEGEQLYGRVWNKAWLKADGKPVRVPCGIVIPHIADGTLWNVRVRRSTDPKYLTIPGGRKALYGVDLITPGLPLFIDEGEFNCMVLQQEVGNLVSPLALASASNAAINPRWYPHLISAPRIYVRADADAAGQAAVAKLQAISKSVVPVQVPEGKDVNDYYLAVGEDRFYEWIQEIVK